MRTAFLVPVTLVLTLLTTGLIADRVEARPVYLGRFIEKYPALKSQAVQAKCSICHPRQDKKVHNEYGKAVKKGIGEPGGRQQDEVIEAALNFAEAQKNSEGLPYGDLIKAGQLPD